MKVGPIFVGTIVALLGVLFLAGVLAVGPTPSRIIECDQDQGTVSLSGIVRYSNGTPVPGAVLTITGDYSAQRHSDAAGRWSWTHSGNFNFDGVYVSVTASKGGVSDTHAYSLCPNYPYTTADFTLQIPPPPPGPVPVPDPVVDCTANPTDPSCVTTPTPEFTLGGLTARELIGIVLLLLGGLLVLMGLFL